MNNNNNYEARLSAAEKERFRELTNTIINQQFQPRILSESEREDFLNLLIKLELYPPTQKQKIESKKSTKAAIQIFSFLSIYILLIGVPITIALLLNANFIFLIYIIFGATYLSIVIIGLAMSKVSYGMLVIVSTPVVAIGVLLFYLLN
ncbi:MAG: hypothetical protein AAFQ14_08175 [Cyanobacteria bacterium J06621_12]